MEGWDLKIWALMPRCTDALTWVEVETSWDGSKFLNMAVNISAFVAMHAINGISFCFEVNGRSKVRCATFGGWVWVIEGVYYFIGFRGRISNPPSKPICALCVFVSTVQFSTPSVPQNKTVKALFSWTTK